MFVLGIISLVLAGLSFLTGMGQDVVFQQYAYFLIGLVLGVLGMGFLILDRLNILIQKVSKATLCSKKEAMPSNTEKLLQLRSLHEQGLLTDEEFSSQKEAMLKNITNENIKK